MKAVFTDLDGTLLDSNFKISNQNLKSLYKIKRHNALNVFVTGRNLFSTQKVLSNNLPLDYLIFSTGIAISNFKSKKILQKFEIEAHITKKIIDLLLKLELNFFVHKPAPDNHFFYYNYSIADSDFEERFKLYSEFSNPIPDNYEHINASQFVIVLPYNLLLFESIKYKIRENFPFLSYIRATSPLNHRHIWLEIYPANVSKGNSMKLLCEKLNISIEDIVAVGNDYNDEDMLDIAGNSFVVDNSPSSLKAKFEVVASNDNNGFSEVIDKIFK